MVLQTQTQPWFSMSSIRSIPPLLCSVGKYGMKLYPASGMCSYRHTKWVLMWSSKQPVDGEWPYSTDAQADEPSAQCLVCFLRAAGGNVSRGPWLGEAGCPGFREAVWLQTLCFLLSTSSPGGKQRHTLPLDFLAFSPAYIQEVAELLMCRQSRRTRLSEAKHSSEYLIGHMKMIDQLTSSLPVLPLPNVCPSWFSIIAAAL